MFYTIRKWVFNNEYLTDSDQPVHKLYLIRAIEFGLQNIQRINKCIKLTDKVLIKLHKFPGGFELSLTPYTLQWDINKYSEIPVLRPPKIKTVYLIKTLFWKFKLFFSSFSTPCVHLIGDHPWDFPKVVFKTTFGQSLRWF